MSLGVGTDVYSLFFFEFLDWFVVGVDHDFYCCLFLFLLVVMFSSLMFLHQTGVYFLFPSKKAKQVFSRFFFLSFLSFKTFLFFVFLIGKIII